MSLIGFPSIGRRVISRPSVFLGVILTAQLMVVLDTAIVNVALPSIQRSLGFSGSALSWVINAYVLSFGGLLLLGARTGDIIGKRRTFLGGIALFSAASLVGGLATAGWMLIAARVVQGVGAAFAAPSALSLLTTAFPEGPRRVRAIALYTTVSAAGAAIGLIAGGLLTELVSWQWVMFVNVPIAVAVLVVGMWVITETPTQHGKFDLLGAITSTLGVTSVVYGLVQAPAVGWSLRTFVTFAIGIALLIGFVAAERKASQPILPLKLFAHSTRTAANVSRGLIYAGSYGLFFFLSQYLQEVHGYSPLRSGLAFLPMPVAVFASSQLASRVLIGRVQQRTLMMAGIVVEAVSLLFGSQIQVGSDYTLIAASLVLMGVSMGTSFVSLTSASLADVEAADAGAASGLINVFQQLGGALGLAILVSSFDFVSGAANAADHFGASPYSRAVFIQGLHGVFLVALLFTALALFLVRVMVKVPTQERKKVVVIEPVKAERCLPRDYALPEAG